MLSFFLLTDFVIYNQKHPQTKCVHYIKLEDQPLHKRGLVSRFLISTSLLVAESDIYYLLHQYICYSQLWT